MAAQITRDISELQLNGSSSSSAGGVEKATTLFPKISDKVTALVRAYNAESRPGFRKTKVIHLVGTVKLHGCHADVLIHTDDSIQLQSRNVTNLTLTNDVHEFAKEILPHKAAFPELKQRYRQRFLQLNPGAQIDEAYPTILAGEWIGPKIQKGVAISDISKRCFVMISVSINGRWLPDEPYGDISNELVGIYNISRGGFYKETIFIPTAKKSHEKLLVPTQAIEKECPFAKNVFGITGRGEGIVWKVVHPLGDDAKFWLKTKGETFAETSAPRPPKLPINAGSLELTRNFAAQKVTIRRLEQGLEYMTEMKIAQTKQSMGRFMDWVKNDIEVEEKVEILEAGLDPGQLRKAIGEISKAWYQKKLLESEQ